MKYVSVCAGIEAATVAWHPLGWTPVCFSEIEPFPCAVLKHHYPDVPLVGDFTQLIEAPPEADLLVGGTPCQAFSVAGKRLSLEDYRGNLSLAFADLWHAGQYEWAVWENVPGVLSTKDNAFGCFLGRLVGADEPCVPGTKSGKWSKSGVVSGPQGTAAWRVLDAQFFGVAQRRRRVFVLARRGAGNGSAPRALFPILEGVCRDLAPRREAGKDVAGTLASRTSAGGGLGTDFDLAGGDTASPVETGFNAEGASGLPFLTQSNIGKHVNNQTPLVVSGSLPHPIVMRQREGKPGGGKGPLLSEDQSLTLAANTNDQVVFAVDKQTASPTEDVTSTLKTDLSHQMGPVVAVAGHVAHALSAEGADASEDGTGRGTPIVAAHGFRESGKGWWTQGPMGLRAEPGGMPENVIVALRPRRLTPRECERLQGFPDDYTLIPWKKGLAVDGLRYKALGNSMAVPVMHWIGKRIQLVEHE